ncbi:hypothetical protein VP01_399g5 [Puccinia sorghi]|uniref:Uncharacterized protein n=1 Tax=Puccinia sorghi TaxID=27349 RepID=A0A0L6US32_9BASI|nr:hypothetical protein VP01_399g5 [Puccinia sorghi]
MRQEVISRNGKTRGKEMKERVEISTLAGWMQLLSNTKTKSGSILCHSNTGLHSITFPFIQNAHVFLFYHIITPKKFIIQHLCLHWTTTSLEPALFVPLASDLNVKAAIRTWSLRDKCRLGLYKETRETERMLGVEAHAREILVGHNLHVSGCTCGSSEGECHDRELRKMGVLDRHHFLSIIWQIVDGLLRLQFLCSFAYLFFLVATIHSFHLRHCKQNVPVRREVCDKKCPRDVFLSLRQTHPSLAAATFCHPQIRPTDSSAPASDQPDTKTAFIEQQPWCCYKQPGHEERNPAKESPIHSSLTWSYNKPLDSIGLAAARNGSAFPIASSPHLSLYNTHSSSRIHIHHLICYTTPAPALSIFSVSLITQDAPHFPVVLPPTHLQPNLPFSCLFFVTLSIASASEARVVKGQPVSKLSARNDGTSGEYYTSPSAQPKGSAADKPADCDEPSKSGKSAGLHVADPAIPLIRAIEHFRDEVTHKGGHGPNKSSALPFDGADLPAALGSQSPTSALPLVAPTLSKLPILHDGVSRAHPLPVGQAGTLPSHLPVVGDGDVPVSAVPNPLTLAHSVTSNLPVSTLPSVKNIPAQDPSSLINRVFSGFPSVPSPLPVGNSSSLPVDPTKLVNPVISHLPVGTDGVPLPSPSSLPVDPSNLTSPVTSDLPAGLPVVGGTSGLPLPIGNSGANLPSLPVDPSSVINRVASTLPVSPSAAGGLPLPVSSLPLDPSHIASPILSNLPAGTGDSGLPFPISSLPVDPSNVDPSSVISPVTSHLPIGDGSSSLPVDPSAVINRVASNLPVSPSAPGGSGLPLPVGALPVDPSTIATPVLSNLRGALPVGPGGSGLPLPTSSLPVDPSNVDPSSVIIPVISHLPVSGDSSSLPVDPSTLIDRVASNLPVSPSVPGGSGLPLPVGSLPVDPTTIASPVLSNLPGAQPPADAGNPGLPLPTSSLPVQPPLDPSSLINPVASHLPIGPDGVDPSSLINRVASDLPITPPSLGSPGLPTSALPVDPAAVASPVIAQLPLSQSGGTAGLPLPVPSLPVDPSTVAPTNLISPVVSNLPGSPAASGSALPLPVDPSSVISTIASNLPGTPVTTGSGGTLPVDPLSVITRVESKLPVSPAAGASPIPALPVDPLAINPSGVVAPVASSSPVGLPAGAPVDPSAVVPSDTLTAGGPLSAVAPGLPSLPVDPSSVINRVTSNLPIDPAAALGASPVNPAGSSLPIVGAAPLGAGPSYTAPAPTGY